MSKWEKILSTLLVGLTVSYQYGYVKGYNSGSKEMRNAMDAQLKLRRRGYV